MNINVPKGFQKGCAPSKKCFKKRCAKKKEIVLKKIAKQTNNGGNTPDFLPVLAYIADFIA